MFILRTLDEAEAFVSEQQSLGNDVRWDNYDIVFFRPSTQGVYSVHGAFRDGQWGFENRFHLNGDGTWQIDPRNIRGLSTINV